MLFIISILFLILTYYSIFLVHVNVILDLLKRCTSLWDRYQRKMLFAVDVCVNLATNKNWQTKLLDGRKVTCWIYFVRKVWRFTYILLWFTYTIVSFLLCRNLIPFLRLMNPAKFPQKQFFYCLHQLHFTQTSRDISWQSTSTHSTKISHW